MLKMKLPGMEEGRGDQRRFMDVVVEDVEGAERMEGGWRSLEGGAEK